LREIGTGDTGRDSLSFLGLGMEEDEAVLIVTHEMVQRNVL